MRIYTKGYDFRTFDTFWELGDFCNEALKTEFKLHSWNYIPEPKTPATIAAVFVREVQGE